MRNTNRIIAQDGVIELNGQFFLQQQDRAQSEFQHLTGEKTISKRAEKRFNRNVKLSAAYCKAKNIPCLHVVYPSKAMTFRDAFAAAGVTLVGIFGDAHRRDEVIYPLDDLVGEEDFETRGSHCNDTGYLKIARTALRSVGAPIDDYQPIFTTRHRQCDLAHMRHLPLQELVTIRNFEGLHPDIREYSNRPMLPGNQGQVSYLWNKAAPINARVLFFGDSFFTMSLPVLAPLFSELIYLRCPYVMEDVANVLAPDIILSGNTERYLVNVPDKTSDTPYFTNFFRRGLRPHRLEDCDRDALFALFSGRDSKEFNSWQAKAGRRHAGAADTLQPEKSTYGRPKSAARRLIRK